MKKFTQLELLKEGFFETLSNITKGVIKAPFRAIGATGKAIQVLDPGSTAKLTKPFTLAKQATAPLVASGKEIIKDIKGKNVQLAGNLSKKIKQQEKNSGREVKNIIKYPQGFLVISAKIGMDPVRSQVRLSYDSAGNFLKKE